MTQPNIYRDGADQLIFRLDESDFTRLQFAIKNKSRRMLYESPALQELYNLACSGQYPYVLAGHSPEVGFLRISRTTFGG